MKGGNELVSGTSKGFAPGSRGEMPGAATRGPRGRSNWRLNRNELRVSEVHTLPRGGVDYRLPVLRGHVPPIAPLPNGNAGDVDVRRHRLCVAVPDGVNGGEV